MLVVSLVVDYADTTMTTRTLSEKLWRFLRDLKWTIRQKKLFGCVYTPISNNLKIWKPLYLKKKLRVCVWHCFRLCRHAIFELCYRMSSRKWKSLFIWGPPVLIDGLLRFPAQHGLPPERQKSLLDLRLVEDMRLGDEGRRRLVEEERRKQQQRRSLALGHSEDPRLGVRI